MRRALLLLGLSLWSASACSRTSSVEQIPVKTPENIAVPADMAYIPEGKFIMGDPQEAGAAGGRETTLPAYLFDKYEVSREHYKRWEPSYRYPEGKGKFPANHITHAEAEGYCQAQNKRLPSEAEWEKAARGTDGRKWPWRVFQEHPNNGFSGFLPEEVDRRPEWISPYGIYGMGHNVWEWTADWHTYAGQPESEARRFKTIRGGLLQTHLHVQASPAYMRNYMEPAARHNFIGFRCAASVKPQS